MELIAQADVVLALGTRLNPFSTLPCYGIDYWPKSAAVIQVDINADRIGLTKPVTVAICGDAKQVARQILERLAPQAGEVQREARKALIAKTMAGWRDTLGGMDHEDDDPGTDGMPSRAPRFRPDVAPSGVAGDPGTLPRDAIISTTSATTAPWATPIRPSSRPQDLAPGLFGPCGYGFPSIIGAKIGFPARPWSASPATAPSASR